MRIFLHIGAEKTGTTSIQQFFRMNRNVLKQEGLLYSAVAGGGMADGENHMALAAAAESDTKVDDLRLIFGLDTEQKIKSFREGLTPRLAEEAAKEKYSTLVFSGEHCSSRLTSPGEVETLARILRPISEEITIILYIRRQDEFLCSTYSTDVKSGHSAPFVVPSGGLQNVRYDYHALLQRWAAVFGKENIVCRLYDLDRLVNGDVVEDFAEIISLRLDGRFRRPPRANESLDVACLEFLRLLNTKIPKFKDKKPNKLRANLVQLLQGLSKGPTLTLPETQMREFMARFRDSNAKVAAEYFDGEISGTGDPLFGPTSGKKNRAEMLPISTETAADFAARLWMKKQEQVLRLSEKVGQLEKASHPKP